MSFLTHHVESVHPLPNKFDKKVADLEAQLAEAKRQRESAAAPQPPAHVAPRPSKHKKKKGRKVELKVEDGVVVKQEQVFGSPGTEQHSRKVVTVSMQHMCSTFAYHMP